MAESCHQKLGAYADGSHAGISRDVGRRLDDGVVVQRYTTSRMRCVAALGS
jgi:hypothetical protein